MQGLRTILNILLVEDNPADVRLVQEAFQTWRLPHRVSVVSDGDEAICFLRRQGKHLSAPPPDLILLDLNLPKRDGREVLAEVKGDPQLRIIPIIVFSTSEAQRDVLRAYDLHANCYLTKPVRLEDFLRQIRAIEDFWVSLARLPHR